MNGEEFGPASTCAMLCSSLWEICPFLNGDSVDGDSGGVPPGRWEVEKVGTGRRRGRRNRGLYEKSVILKKSKQLSAFGYPET